jgi:lipoprotein-anchoring transpeptidase ErfK/SrfK
MGRSHRVSRSLLGLLSVVLVLGFVFYLNNVRQSRAQEAAEAKAKAQPHTAAAGTSGAAAGSPSTATVATTPLIRLTPPATQPGQLPERPLNPTVANPVNSAPTAPPAAGLLAEASAKKSAGDLLASRKMLNQALLSRRISPTEAESAKQVLAEINQAMVFSPKVFAGDEFSGEYTVRSGQLLRSIAEKHEVPWELLARLNGLSDPRKLRAGQNIKIVTGPFHAVVSKSRFNLDIYLGSPGEQGSLYIRSFDVGLGANDSTPTGSWLVETHKKIKNPTYFSPRGEGVIDADDPRNPLGERWIGLTGIDGQAIGKQSYGIHGTIEPDSIGKQASMGCIRLRNEDAELLFDLLTEGKSLVVVKE